MSNKKRAKRITVMLSRAGFEPTSPRLSPGVLAPKLPAPGK